MSCLPAYLAPCGNERQLGWLDYNWDLRGCSSLRLSGRLSHAAIAALAGALRLSCISELDLGEVTWLADSAPLADALVRTGAPRLARLSLPCLPSRDAVLNLTAACEAQRGLHALTLGRCEYSSTASGAAVASFTRCVVEHPSLVSAAADEAPAAFAAALAQAQARRERLKLTAAGTKAGAKTVRPAEGAAQALTVAWGAHEEAPVNQAAVGEHTRAPDARGPPHEAGEHMSGGGGALLAAFGTLLATAWLALLRAWRARVRVRAVYAAGSAAPSKEGVTETSVAASAKGAEAPEPEAQGAAADGATRSTTEARPAPPPRQHRPPFDASGAAPAPHTPSPPSAPVASPCSLPSRHRKFVASAPAGAAAANLAVAALESAAASVHQSGVTPTGSTGGSPEAPPSPPLAPAPPPRLRPTPCTTPAAHPPAEAAARPALTRTPSFPPPPPRASAPTFPAPPPPRTPSFPLPPHQTPTPTASHLAVLPAAATPPAAHQVEPRTAPRSALSPPPASPEPPDAQPAAATTTKTEAAATTLALAHTLTPRSSPKVGGWLARLSGGNEATDDDTGTAADGVASPCFSGSSHVSDSASSTSTDTDAGVTVETDLPWAAWALPPTATSAVGAAEAATAADDAVAASAAEAAAAAATDAEGAAMPEASIAASFTPVAAHEAHSAGGGDAADRYFSMLWGSPSL